MFKYIYSCLISIKHAVLADWKATNPMQIATSSHHQNKAQISLVLESSFGFEYDKNDNTNFIYTSFAFFPTMTQDSGYDIICSILAIKKA